MPRKRFNAEDIIQKLREASAHLSQAGMYPTPVVKSV